MFGEVFWGHVDGGAETAGEHALPLLLGDVLAMVASGHGFGGPFLLEKSFATVGIEASGHHDHVIQVVLVP